jgi:hypothetical protein
MSITSIDKLKSYFKTGAKPTQEQFHALLDSYIHKSEDTSYILQGLAGATFMGVATPDSVPPVPTQKVFYIANEVGSYPNYGGLAVSDSEIAFFTYNGSWGKVALEDVARKSEVKAKFTELSSQVIFDVSEYNKVDNKPKTYTDLSEALTDVPVSKCHGGMSIRYIQSFDNKYVQYRLMSDTFNTTPANWQGVDDEPTQNSINLVESGGIEKQNIIYNTLRPYLNIPKYKYWPWETVFHTSGYHRVISTFGANKLYIKRGADNFYIHIVKSYHFHNAGDSITDYATGESGRYISDASLLEVSLPSDAKYVIIGVNPWRL